jgi:glycosyltransferase involved in cell wall biosynthesis
MYKYVVSMIIVARNEEHHIKKAIDALRNQNFDRADFEIIIVDGTSEDATVVVAKQYLESYHIPYKIITNVKKNLAPGWNLGLKAAEGRYVVRPDAHAELLPGYVKTGIKKLEQDETLAAVGGVLETKADTYTGKLVSKILSNPMGVGTSLFRVGVKKDTYSDTAVYAVYRKDIFNIAGGFNEAVLRNQDIDFHKKVAALGYRFLTSPEMKAIYYSRTTAKYFLTQGYENGYWVTYGRGGHFRHLIPLFFIIFLMVSLFIDASFCMLFLTFYFIAVAGSFVIRSKVFNPVKLFIIAILTFGLHLTYGFGSLIGLYTAVVKGFKS